VEFSVLIDPADGEAAALLARLAERAEVTPLVHAPGTALVLGGARSGKSSWAEAQLAAAADVEYVATSEVVDGDAEWAERVALHVARRPLSWRTTETKDLAAVLGSDDPAPVLIDCAAVWLDRVLMDSGAWDDFAGWREGVEAEVSRLAEALARTTRDVIVVSNEVGSGIVPATPSGRLYRDELGRLNARLAAVCREVWLCTAGIARRLK
jgi:adenosylcobinamide kinase/adenosylcobinamide-phosphate guanylyltransferase